MTSSRALLVDARTALAEGRRREAGRLLARAVRLEPDNYRIWLLLAQLAPTPADSANCIERAAVLAPDAPAVTEARAWLAESGRQAAVSPALPASPTSLDAPAPAAAESAAAPDAEEALRAAATEPAASRRRPMAAALLLVLVLAVMIAAAALLLPRWLSGPVADASPAAEAIAYADPAPDRPATDDVSSPATLPAPTADPLPAGAGPATPAGDGVRALGKPVVAGDSGQPAGRWTPTPTLPPTPTPSPTPSPSPTLLPTFVSSAAGSSAVSIPLGVGVDERWIDVNLTTQTLAAYEGNRLVFSTLISSGLPATPTVTGQFRVYLRFESQTMDGRRLGYDYYLPNVPFVMYFYGDYALHGTYWHSNFGYPMSHGCVNLETSDARWLFEWAGIGTLVNVHY